ncbi:MAG: hypothetical protein ACW99A_09710 [Candidatus Kariarchaeaceae archaeon]
MDRSIVARLKFHDGRKYKITSEKMYAFDNTSIFDRYYPDKTKEAYEVFEDLGGFALDFTNLFEGFEEIPDINDKSSRLFTLWAEDEEKNEVVLILRGIFVLTPYNFSSQKAKNYYLGKDEDDLYYPTAVLTVFRTTYVDIDQLEMLINRSLIEIEAQWKMLRDKAIDNLPSNTRLWRRYVNSIDKLIHFTFQIPSIDREILDTLKRKNYRITNFMMLLASTTPSYDSATLEYHIKETQKLYPPLKDS